MVITKEMLQRDLESLEAAVKEAEKVGNDAIQRASVALEQTKMQAAQHVGEAQGRVNAVKNQIKFIEFETAKEEKIAEADAKLPAASLDANDRKRGKGNAASADA